MRRTIFFLLIFALLVSFASASPSSWNMAGKITLGGEGEDMVLVKVSDISKGTSLVKETRDGGEFNFDISEFPSAVMGDSMSITFCYDSWQCPAATESFSYSGAGRGLLFFKDFSSQPASFEHFLVQGIVTEDGVGLEGVVEVQNMRTGKGVSLVLENGEYIINIADLVYGWLFGDIIQVCYGQVCKSSEILEGRPSLDVSFDLSDPDVHVPGVPYGHDKRRWNYDYNIPDPVEPIVIPDPVEPDDEDDVVIPIPPDPVIIPDGEVESMAWLWILIIVIVLVVGVGYWFMKKR